MHYLVDAYNIIFQYFDEHSLSLEGKRELLIRLCEELINKKNIKITLIFDGNQVHALWTKHTKSPNLEIAFSEHNQTADQYILEELSSLKRTNNVIVITSDNRLSLQCRQRHVKTKTSSSFLKLLLKKHVPVTNDKPQFKESELQIQRLEQIFTKKIQDND